MNRSYHNNGTPYFGYPLNTHFLIPPSSVSAGQFGWFNHSSLNQKSSCFVQLDMRIVVGLKSGNSVLFRICAPFLPCLRSMSQSQSHVWQKQQTTRRVHSFNSNREKADFIILNLQFFYTSLYKHTWDKRAKINKLWDWLWFVTRILRKSCSMSETKWKTPDEVNSFNYNTLINLSIFEICVISASIDYSAATPQETDAKTSSQTSKTREQWLDIKRNHFKRST